MGLVGFVILRSLERKNKKGKPETELRFPFLLLILLFSDQVSDDHVSVAIVFLIVVSENVLAVAVTENMVIYEEEGARLWIGYPLNMCNILADGDL